MFSENGQWCCIRCRRRDDNAVRSASCSLCELRGGALIPLEDVRDLCLKPDLYLSSCFLVLMIFLENSSAFHSRVVEILFMLYVHC